MNGTNNSKINFEIPRFITKQPNILYHSLKLLHAEIPYSFYIINETNNVINFVIDAINHFYVVPVGNYNGLTLATTLNALFNGMPGSYFLASSFDINTNQLNISINSGQTGFKIYPDFELKFG